MLSGATVNVRCSVQLAFPAIRFLLLILNVRGHILTDTIETLQCSTSRVTRSIRNSEELLVLEEIALTQNSLIVILALTCFGLRVLTTLELVDFSAKLLL